MDILRERLGEVRQRARRVLWTQGASLVAAVVIGLLLVVGFSDWITHYSEWSLVRFLGQPFDDPAVRWMLSFALLAAAGFVTWWSLIRPLRIPLHDVDLALRVESRYPRLKDSFASAVQFVASDNDPRIGSPALQRSVVERAMSQLDRIELQDIVDTKRLKLLATAAIVTGIVGLLVVGLNRSATAIAMQRLAFPWSAPEWPRRTNLQLLTPELRKIEHHPDNPLRIARGDSLELYVENTVGRLPSDVRLEYRIAGGKLLTESLRIASVRDAAGNPREVAVGAIQATRSPIEFRAVGGDHGDMPFYRMLAIPAPSVESLKLSVQPPAYAGRKSETLPEGTGQVEALVGSSVEIEAHVTKPVRWAALKLKDQKPRAVTIAKDRQSLKARFIIEQPGIDSWWLDVQDDEGLQNVDASRYEIRGIPDQVPDVHLELPATDIQVTPEADLSVKATARDDLGLQGLRLVWHDSHGAKAPTEPGDAPAKPQERPLFDGEGRPQQHTAEYLWQLAELQKQPGDEIVFHIEATDDCDIGPPHIGRSPARRLTFVSAEQKTAELAERQAGLLDELERAYKLQEQAHAQVNELRLQLNKTGTLRPEDADALQRVELSQRQLTRQLTDPAEGLETRAKDILQDLQANKLKDPETESRVSQLATEIRRLAEENLPPIEDELTAARKAAQARDQAAPLERAAENQQAVLESLGEMLKQLAQWRNERDAARDLADVIAEQDDLRKQTAEIGPKTVNKAPADLTPQEQAELAKLAERQRKQAEKLEQLQNRVEDTAKRLEDQEPGSGESLEAAVKHAREESVADRMRDAADSLAENQTGKAGQSQQEALNQLREMDNILRNRRESDTESLVKKLKQAEEDLQKLEEQQDELMKKVQQAEQIADPQERAETLKKLREQQEQVQEELAKLSRRLQRLQARESGDAAQRAAERLAKARQNMEQGQEAEAEQEQREALDDLQQARRELAQDREEAEETLAQQQLARIADKLKAMIPRQQQLIEETLRLENLRKGSEWTRSQLQTLLGLARTQRELQEETDKLTETLSAAEVFSLALKGASRHMLRAAEQLAARDTGPLTVRAQEAARKRFEDLVGSLKPETLSGDQPSANPQQQPGQGQGEQGGPPTDGVPILSQLRMLKTLQQELNERTNDLAKLFEQNGVLTPQQKAELAEIAKEQGEVADLARNLTEQAAKLQQPAEETAPQESEPEDAK